MGEERQNPAGELNTLLDTDPAAAVRRARALPEAGFDDALAKGAVLVNGGDAAGEVDAIEEGVRLFRRLRQERPQEPTLAYNLANGLMLLAGCGPSQAGARAAWLDRTAGGRLQARALLAEAIEHPHATVALRVQASLNLANDLSKTYRLGEAHDLRLAALRMDPRNGVAAALAAKDLWWLYSRGTCSEVTLQEARLLARTTVENAAEMQAYVGAKAAADLLGFAKRLDAGTGDSAPHLDRSAPADPFLAWVERERLTLGPTPELVDPELGKIDWLMLPDILDRWGQATRGSLPAVFAMFNTLKTDFGLARELAWGAQLEGGEPSSSTERLVDTLDYARYDRRVSELVLAHRSALDVLDKVAVLANHYFELGVAAHRIHFRTLWRKKKGSGIKPLLPAVESVIGAGCFALGGLVELADDYDSGFRKPLRDLRNAATHRFIVVHDLGGEARAHEAAEVERWGYDAFRQETVRALRVARSAIQVLAIAVAQHECVLTNQITGPVGSLSVPDHDWVRRQD